MFHVIHWTFYVCWGGDWKSLCLLGGDWKSLCLLGGDWKSLFQSNIILKVSWDNIDLSDLIAKQAEFNLEIIQSVRHFQDKVLSLF